MRLLCVGGPCAGDWYDVDLELAKAAGRLIVRVPLKREDLALLVSNSPTVEAVRMSAEYRLQRFATADHLYNEAAVYYLVPIEEARTAHMLADNFRLLLDAYSKLSRMRKADPRTVDALLKYSR